MRERLEREGGLYGEKEGDRGGSEKQRKMRGEEGQLDGDSRSGRGVRGVREKEKGGGGRGERERENPERVPLKLLFSLV